MEYLIQIAIAEGTDEVTRRRIKKNLHGDTLRLALFPMAKMPVRLLDGSEIVIEKVLPLQKENLKPDAIALVRPLTISTL